MATFNAVNASSGVRFDLFSIASLLAGSTTANTSVTFTRTVDANTSTTFTGTGFAYAGGLFNGGTISDISSVANGQTQFTISNLAMPVAQFRAFASAGNSQGFLAAIFIGDDTLTGSAFADHLRGYAGNDTLVNNPGNNDNDTLDGGLGADSMDGADGDDLYIVDNAGDTTTDSSGFDTVKSSVSYDIAGGVERLILTGKGNLDGGGDLLANQIFGTAGANVLSGRDGNDLLDGGTGNDSLDGGGHNDTLLGGIGIDTMTGGDGDDLFIVDNAKDSITDSSGIDSVQSGVSHVLAADLEHLFLTGAGKLNGTGNASANQIVGSTGANKLLGLDANDILDGGAGNDTLDGGTGDDTMLGGAGNDVYFAGSTSDQISESIAGKAGGIDMVFSSADITLGANIENLTLIGTGPALVANGNALNNVIVVKNATASGAVNDLHGDGGNDTLIGAAGNDALDGGAGADVMIGGGSDDFYSVDDGDKVVETLAGPSGGTDLVNYSGSKNYTLGANVERLNMISTSGDLSAFGNGLSNEITGNFDDNLIDGKSGADTMLGLKGDDVYFVDNALDRIDEQNGVANGGIDTVRSSINFNLSDNGTTVQGEFEHLILLGKASVGSGNDLSNALTGNSGKNTLVGFGGDDTLDGGIGADSLEGGSGNDVYVLDSKLDVVKEGVADTGDTISSSKLSLDLSLAAYANIENVVLTGKAALNATGNGGDNGITGNDGANKLIGLDGNDTLIGGAGNDTLDGGAGVDMLLGGSGNDTYIIEGSDIAVGALETGGSGIDTFISLSDISLATLGEIENLTLAAGSGATNGAGNFLDNVLVGNELANDLFGAGGRDTIDGGAGNDGIDGGIDNDFLIGGVGNDGIGGGPGSDTIDGGAGDDTVRGGADADVIIVSSGNDTILYSLGEGGDLIKGFDGNPVGGQDVLDLDGLFDGIPLAGADRVSHVLILDHGATVDVLVDADNNLANGYELTVATIQTKDAVTIGEDVLLGTL